MLSRETTVEGISIQQHQLSKHDHSQESHLTSSVSTCHDTTVQQHGLVAEATTNQQQLQISSSG